MGLGLGEGEAQESPRIIYFCQTEHWPERQSLGVALPGWGSRRDGQGRPKDPGITALKAQDFFGEIIASQLGGQRDYGEKRKRMPRRLPRASWSRARTWTYLLFFPSSSFLQRALGCQQSRGWRSLKC